MLAYIFIFVLGVSPVLQAVFDLPLQLAFQQAVLLACLAWVFLKAYGGGVPSWLSGRNFYPLWGAAALTFAALLASPFKGWIFNEWGNYAAGLLIFVFASSFDPADRAKTDRAVLWGAWLVFLLSLAQVFLLGNFAVKPPLTNLNALALYAVMVFPLALERKAWPLAGAMFVLVIWTQSLGAALAGLTAAGVYSVSRLKRGGLKKNAWLLGGLAALAAAVFFALQADSVAGRLAWWGSAIEMFKARPFIGFGHAAFTWAQGGFQPEGAFREHSIYAHNYYLEFLAENGLPAAICWFWALFAAARAKTGLVKYSIIAALAHSVMDFGLSVPANFWLFCYLLSQARASAPQAAPAPCAAPGRRLLPAALGLAVLLEAALLNLDIQSMAFEAAGGRALAAARKGDFALAEAQLRPALDNGLLRAPALEYLGRLNLGAGDAGFRAAVYYEMTLLENRYSAVSWLSLKKIYSRPGLEAEARGLERRRAEVFK